MKQAILVDEVHHSTGSHGYYWHRISTKSVPGVNRVWISCKTVQPLDSDLIIVVPMKDIDPVWQGKGYWHLVNEQLSTTVS